MTLKISPFAIHKTLIGIGGEPKSLKRLRSGILLIEISPHKSLNSCRGVIFEPVLLDTPDSEILEGLSDQGVIQCQRFGHSQNSCHGQLTCSRCASVGHSSTDCTLEPKCINCSQLHTADSKLCPKWKTEKQIQEIKTNKNISNFEARKLIVPQLTQTYAQVTKPSTISTATQTDPNISNIICPPLQCLTPISSKTPLHSTSSSVSTFSTSSSSTQDNLLPSPSGILPTIQKSVPTTSDSEHSNAAEIQKFVKRISRNRRKRPKVQKPEIEIKMSPHRSRKAAPTEITTDDEDIITYDVEEEKLEQDPPNKFTFNEDPLNFPKGYLRSLTPSRYRNRRE
ncbi:RNA-directed DNA polymerase from mobile element jockey [Trichonephila clavipes]|nr:RNA-directed DNA polymerase from mobile element jockey [Trichonephila clavipes]